MCLNSRCIILKEKAFARFERQCNLRRLSRKSFEKKSIFSISQKYENNFFKNTKIKTKIKNTNIKIWFFYFYFMAKLERQDSNFTQVSNFVLLNKNLSAKAKWVYAYMYSRTDNWDFSAERIALDFSDGIKSIRSALAELENEWFLTREKQATWQMIYFLWIEPKCQKGILRSESPKCRKGKVPKRQSAEKAPLNNIDIYNNIKSISSFHSDIDLEKSQNSKNNFPVLENSEKNSENQNLSNPEPPHVGGSKQLIRLPRRGGWKNPKSRACRSAWMGFWSWLCRIF